MPDTNTVSHPAFSYCEMLELMQFNRALLIICNDNNAICRRKKWGSSVTHVYAEVYPAEGIQLIIIDEVGRLSWYTPSIDDLKADDWMAG